jgi:hypothetical protein
MQKGNILIGYTSQQTAYKVENYPWGFKLRTSIHYWIETVAGKGDRFCSYTIDPKTGRACKPKKSTYSPFMYMYLDENGHVKNGIITAYEQDMFEARFEFLKAQIGVELISAEQQQNIRHDLYGHTYGNARWTAVKYSDEKRPEFVQWMKDRLTHIRSCEFENLMEFREAPVQDRPERELEFKVTERQAESSI